MNLEVVSILAFTFNTESIKMCGDLEGNYKCDVADFWPEFRRIIQQTKPHIIAIGFQEDAKPGSFFHSNLLPHEMQKDGYTLLDRENLMGVGKTTFTGVKNGDFFMRGLRLSIYVRTDSLHAIKKEYPNGVFYTSVAKNKGAIAIYLTLPNGSRLAIINTHFPFHAESLLKSSDAKDYLLRLDSAAIQSSFFNELYQQLVIGAPADVNHVLLMGDLNYRMVPFENWSGTESGELILTSPNLYRSYDELFIEMNSGNVPLMQEGVNNTGPLFAPTCKMRKMRLNDAAPDIQDYNIGKQDARVPSYCDRILYQNYGDSAPLRCLVYDRFDKGIMNKSDHAGVYGIYSFV